MAEIFLSLKKNKTSQQIKQEVKQKIFQKEIIICEGMKVEVLAHKYTVFCETNDMENKLRKFIELYKIEG